MPAPARKPRSALSVSFSSHPPHSMLETSQLKWSCVSLCQPTYFIKANHRILYECLEASFVVTSSLAGGSQISEPKL